MRFTSPVAAILIAFAVTAAPVAAGETPASTSGDAAVQKFGTPVTVKKAVSVAKLEKKPAKYTGKTVKIEGTVRDVCQGRGCWIEIESRDGATFMAKSLDESVLVPKDCQGWNVVVEGVVTPLNAKGHENHAHDAAMEEGHSCPIPNYVVATRGVELRKATTKK